MRVALDVTPLAGERTGIGLFVHELARGLASLAAGEVGSSPGGREPDLEIVGLAMTARGRDSILKTLPPNIGLGRPAPARLLREAWRRTSFPPVELLTGPVDLVHGTNYVVPPTRRAAALVTVADLGAWHTPDIVHPASRVYPELVKRALDRGAHIHAMSEHVAAEIRSELGVEAERVHTIPIGVSPLPAGEHQRGRRLVGSGPYLLAVGTIEPRKGFPAMVEALAKLSSEHPDLVLAIAGGRGWGSDALDTAIGQWGMEERVVKLGFVNDQDKADLLAGAELLVSAATYEGFGLVPLEAMAAGLPVVAVAGGSIPEVCGEAARLVVTGESGALAAAISEVLGDDALRSQMEERGRRQAAAFSWERTVLDMVSLYRRLVGLRSR